MASPRMHLVRSLVPVLALCLAACDGNTQTGSGGSGGAGAGGSGGSSSGGGGQGGNAASPQDILTTDLQLDLATRIGKATVVVVPASGSTTVDLEVGGLKLNAMTLDGAPAEYTVSDGHALIDTKGATGAVTVVADYLFPARPSDKFDGWMPASGVTFLWPYFCSNLFPCTSAPDDGVTFTMTVTGTDAALTAIYPKTTTSDAPSYMPAVAVGEYTKVDLGATKAGTKLSVWHLPGEEALAQDGTAHLKSVFDFYESTYGAYSFGPEAGSVSADWGPGAFGGMEHHPFFHVGKDDLGNEEVHAHEAAHGWFGDGVRIACWEDFVLSEGTVTYLAAHGLERVGGPNLWPSYVDDLDTLCTGGDVNTVALPSTCNEIDLLNNDLWSLVPYLKGACFYEDVADLIGPGVVDQVLGEFYKAHVGKAARMSEMIDALKAAASDADKAQIDTLVTEWLLTEACPADYAARCSAHMP
ncbi:MAG: M1 family aminopeptidase [Polyangiaceae bacterium]